MGSSLAKVMSHVDAGKLISAVFKPNRRTGASTAKIVGDGIVETLTVTKTGYKIITRYIAPAGSAFTKQVIAKDLHKNGVKGIDIADLLQVSSSTISRWLK